jgi:hypothetical protein
MQPSDDPELLRALLQCLAPPYANLLVGTLPPEWSLEFRLPPDARVLGGSTGFASSNPDRPEERRPPPLTAYFEAPGTVTNLAVFYVDACREHGWKPNVDGYPQPRRLPDGRVLDLPTGFYAGGPDNRFLQVQIRPLGDGRCGIQLDTGWQPPREHTEFDEMMKLIDRVLYPSDRGRMVIMPGGGYGHRSFAIKDATAIGGRDVRETAASIARRCRAAGWKRHDGAASGPVAWSRWSVPGDEEYEGVLIVMEETGPRRAIIKLKVQRKRGTSRDDALSEPSRIFSD